MTTALVTGANRGIGLELTRQLLDRGSQVLAVCRQASDELKGSGAQIIEGIDLTETAGIERLVSSIDEPIDLLINNAGLLTKESLDHLDLAMIRKQF